MKKFAVGRLLVTLGAKEEMERVSVDEIELLGRHQGGDWSEMEIDDQEDNEYSLGEIYGYFQATRIKM